MNYHTDTIVQIDNDRFDSKTYETYYYCGKYMDGYDAYGPIYVYHYISNSKLKGRDLDRIDYLDGDLEIWHEDKYWKDASMKKDIILEIIK